MSLQMPLEAISRRSLHHELVDRLQDMIIDGQLLPGTKIPEKDLCTRFAVSRTPMREALKVLAAEGLIHLEPNRGAWVSEVTFEELESVFPVMGALEALSGELACKRITDEEIAEIRSLHDEMVAHYRNRDLPSYFRSNQMIHNAILTAAGNGTLTAHYRSLEARVLRARYVANMSEARWSQAVEEHTEILNALTARRGKKLAGVLKRHIQNKFETVKQWLDHENSKIEG